MQIETIETRFGQGFESAVEERRPCLFSEKELAVLQKRIEGETEPQIVEDLGTIGLEGVKKRFERIAQKTAGYIVSGGLTTAGDSCDFNYLAIVIGVWQEWLDVSHLPEEPTRSFTAREKEVIGLMVRGYRGLAIQDNLAISYETTKKHRANIMEKLRGRSQFQVVAWGARVVRTERDGCVLRS